MLVFARVESLEVVPSELDSFLEALEAVENSALIVTVTTAGVSECTQVRSVLLKLTEGLLSVHLEDNNHKSAHQVDGVGELHVVGRLSVVVDTRLTLEAIALEQFLQLTAESVRH